MIPSIAIFMKESIEKILFEENKDFKQNNPRIPSIP